MQITNGDFLIIDQGGTTNTGTGDGIDEETTWTFDFTRDPQFLFFPTSFPLASARLTLELTPRDPLIDTDAVGTVGLRPILTPVIQNLPVHVTSTIEIDLVNFYTSRELLNTFRDTAGHVPMFYADDAIVSFAALTLALFPGELVNSKFPPLGPEDAKTSFDHTPCAPGAPMGTFIIEAEFKNISSDTLSTLFFEVDMLTGPGNVLCNADGGSWGKGARLTVPLDGPLRPGESFTVEFMIGLANMNPFTFLVDLFGVVW